MSCRLIRQLPALLFIAAVSLSVVFSLCPHPSRLELMRILGCALLFLIAARTFRRRADAVAAAWTLTLFGAGFATLGLITYGSELLGFSTFSERLGRLSLTFANPNHFAALLSMLGCLALGLAASHRGARRAFLLLCSLYLTAVFFTASRGGVVSLGLALILLLAGLALAGRRQVWKPLAATVALTAAMAAVLGPRTPRDPARPSRRGGRPGRDLGRRLGDGAGEAVDRLGPRHLPRRLSHHQPRRLAGRVVAHAHSDYLELAAEAGLPALGLALLTLAAFAATALRRLARGADPGAQAIGLGAFAGCVALLLHSTANFNLHIPAVAWLFVVLAALALHTGDRREPPASAQRGPAMTAGIAVAVLLATAVALATVAVPYLDERWLNTARQLIKERRFEAAAAYLEPLEDRALQDPGVRTELGSAAFLTGLSQSDPELRNRFFERAVEHHRRACQECPIRASSFGRIATALRSLGRFDEAAEALERAVELAPFAADRHFQLDGFQLARAGDDSTAASYARALELDPRLAEPVFTALSRAGWTS